MQSSREDRRNHHAAQAVQCGVIAVVRLPSAEQVVRVAQALLEGGVNSIEVTLTTQGAVDAIRQLRAELGAAIVVGAGSVLNVESAERALDAGAQYLVSPVMVDALVSAAHARGAATMVGAFTPSEMIAVHRQQSDFIKLFPADSVGPAFLKGVLAPIPSLRVVPTGGITAANAAAWIQAGAVAVGAGSSLVDPALVKSEQWSELTARALAFVDAVTIAREGTK